ncbi:uncharacterized protein (AIM24 family) [Nocardioides thalensis]|uniref:Uncharacterized protein (AIM24 family) n=1 Tax=Nocardioides thalensis TaxID=1914755 RepID=A0A853BWK7_9ACTN|nr:AIM24 family protein [Nocardioides thalensis]NYJ00300.1 uncharacterized protein (AIM24 family) [Nocardioides thalensis]
MTAAAWHPDPTGQHELRYWDGSQWTEHVSDGGVVSTAPLQPPAQPESQHDASAGSGEASPFSEDSSDATMRAGGDPLTDPYSESSSADESAPSVFDAPADETPADEQPADDPFAATRVVPQQQVEEQAAEEQAAEEQAAEEPAAQAPSYESSAPTYEAGPSSYEATPPAFGGAPPAYTPEQQPLPAHDPYAQQPPMGQPHVGGPSAYGDAFGGITGDLIDGRYSEVGDTPGPSLQNSKMLKVRINEPFMARQGSMVAYQGNVNFAYQGGGAAKFLKKAVTGEGLSLMRVEGQGDVFLADIAANVHILHLNNSGLSVNGKNILAFSANLQWNIERVKGGSIAAGGLFNTTLRGTGWVAITTDGDPVVLNAQEAPTFADANALVAWSVQLQTGIKSSFTAGALIGRGSGEAFQVTFNGPGFVIVQPSEGVPPVPTA